MDKKEIVDGKTWCVGHQGYVSVELFDRDNQTANGCYSRCKECRKLLPSRKSKKIAPVAHLDSATDYESVGKRFEPSQEHQKRKRKRPPLKGRRGHKKECPKCKLQIGIYPFNKHVSICDGSGRLGTIPKYPRNEDDTITCPICSKCFSKNGIGSHISRAHNRLKLATPSWNKGKTKETDSRIAAASLKLTGRPSKMKGMTHTTETKAKVSAAMKKAHSEGRGWSIGKTRNQREPSYPEKFFMLVIENEFTDKDYQQEYRVSKFAIDFAWVEKKIAIEIDGQFHSLPEYVERDARKDKCLEENGWKLLRIPWKLMYADPKTWIERAKQHVHAG